MRLDHGGPPAVQKRRPALSVYDSAWRVTAALLRGFLARVLEQEVECLLRPDMARDPADRAFLLELRARHSDRFALLACDALDFAVDLLLRGSDRLSFGDSVEQQGRLYIAQG